MKIKTERVVFPFPEYPKTETLKGHPFGSWLLNQNARENEFFAAFDKWAAGLGFDINQHTVEPDYLKTCHYVFDSCFGIWYAEKYAFEFADIFTESKKGFYLYRQGINSQGKRYKLTEYFGEYLAANFQGSLIYQIKPEHFTFEIIGRRVLIKYQQIIGSRFVCSVIGQEG